MFKTKFIQGLKNIVNPITNFVAFSKEQSKFNEDYIKSLSTGELKIKKEEEKLESMVRQQLKEEFPNIEKSSSYELLVDAVIHNYKAKENKMMDEQINK